MSELNKVPDSPCKGQPYKYVNEESEEEEYEDA